MRGQKLYNQLSLSVRLSAPGYRIPHPDEIFYRSQAEAEAAGEFYPICGFTVSPSILMEFQQTRMILGVPISDCSKADMLFTVCQSSGAFGRIEVVWQLGFLY